MSSAKDAMVLASKDDKSHFIGTSVKYVSQGFIVRILANDITLDTLPSNEMVCATELGKIISHVK